MPDSKSDQAASVLSVVEAFYRGFLTDDIPALGALMAETIELSFLGSAPLHGRMAALQFFEEQAGAFRHVDFRLADIVVDGTFAAGIWSETVTPHHGDPWENHGVDIFEVGAGAVLSVHEHNDLRVLPSPARASDGGGV